MTAQELLDTKEKTNTRGWDKYFLSFFGKEYPEGYSETYLIGRDVYLYHQNFENTAKPVVLHVGTLPFIPTIVEDGGNLSCSWYKVVELSREDDCDLNLNCSWNGGKSYSQKWNRESKWAWCSFFFCQD